MSYVTKRDIDFPTTLARPLDPAFTLPKGTPVILVKGASGTEGDLWAVRDAKIIMDLTGNTHDPKYRYTWVNADDVEEG